MQCAKCEAMEFMLRKAWRRQEQLESALRITQSHLEAFLIKDLTKNTKKCKGLGFFARRQLRLQWMW